MDYARRAGDGLASSDDEFLGDGAARRGDADEVGTRREGADVERGAVARGFPIIHLHAGGVVDLYPLQPEAGEHLHPLCRRVGLQADVPLQQPHRDAHRVDMCGVDVCSVDVRGVDMSGVGACAVNGIEVGRREDGEDVRVNGLRHSGMVVVVIDADEGIVPIIQVDDSHWRHSIGVACYHHHWNQITYRPAVGAGLHHGGLPCALGDSHVEGVGHRDRAVEIDLVDRPRRHWLEIAHDVVHLVVVGHGGRPGMHVQRVARPDQSSAYRLVQGQILETVLGRGVEQLCCMAEEE